MTPQIETIQLVDLMEDVEELSEEALGKEAEIAYIEEEIQADEAAVLEIEAEAQAEIVEEEIAAMADETDAEAPEEEEAPEEKKHHGHGGKHGRGPKALALRGEEGALTRKELRKQGEYRDHSS